VVEQQLWPPDVPCLWCSSNGGFCAASYANVTGGGRLAAARVVEAAGEGRKALNTQPGAAAEAPAPAEGSAAPAPAAHVVVPSMRIPARHPPDVAPTLLPSPDGRIGHLTEITPATPRESGAERGGARKRHAGEAWGGLGGAPGVWDAASGWLGRYQYVIAAGLVVAAVAAVVLIQPPAAPASTSPGSKGRSAAGVRALR
jgi:hypothetical protein